MTAINKQNTDYPAGPETPYDIHSTTETFTRLCEWIPRYGDVFYVQPVIRKAPAFVVNDPDVLKHILIKNNKNYTKGAVFERVKMLLGNGIIVSDGPFWRKQRRMVQPAFNKDTIEHLFAQIKICNQNLLTTLLASTTAPIDITAVTNELALEIMLRSIFSTDYDTMIIIDGANPFSILTESSERNLQLAVKFRALTNVIQSVIEYRRANPEEKIDFLAVLMAARDKDGEAMTDKELIDEVMTLIVAGSETSAATMNWVWHSMSQYPEVETKVHAEIDALDFSDAPSFEQLSELKYLRQVMDEVLRLYPPVWLYSRKAIEEDRIGDYVFPAGADIFIAPYFMHRKESLWPNAERFDPERFNETTSKQRHKLAYIPFSAGPRRCIGDLFGIHEAQMHFAIIAKHLRMRLNDDKPLELAPEVNLRSRHPFIMKLETR